MASIPETVKSIDTRVLVALCAVGLVLMAAGFIGYVIGPDSLYTYVFVVGVVILAVGYALLNLDSKMAMVELEKASRDRGDGSNDRGDGPQFIGDDSDDDGDDRCQP